MCEVHAALKTLLNEIALFRGAGISRIGEHGSEDLRLQSSHGVVNDSTAASDDSDNHANACWSSGLGCTRGVYTPRMQDASTALYTPLALDDVDSNATCKSCAFFRRGPFCHFCQPGALKLGRRSRRRKRLKESAEAVENFM
jgi:hypothetical protein